MCRQQYYAWINPGTRLWWAIRTIPDIVKKITGVTVSIAENDYDNLFIIAVTQILFFKTKKLLRTTYGLSSP